MRTCTKLRVFDGEIVYKKRSKTSDGKEVLVLTLYAARFGPCMYIVTYAPAHNIHKLIGATIRM